MLGKIKAQNSNDKGNPKSKTPNNSVLDFDYLNLFCHLNFVLWIF